jgi:hypothetical protein
MPVELNTQLRVHVAVWLVHAVPALGTLMQVDEAGPVDGSQAAGVESW